MSEQYARTKIGRNAPCPCGSGKKHKRCCLTQVEHPHTHRCAGCGKEFELSEEVFTLDLSELESLSETKLAELIEHASRLG